MDTVSHRILRWGRLRRLLFFGLTLGTALSASALLLDVLKANGLSNVEVLGLVLFFTLSAWIAGAAWTAIAGFVIQLAGRDPAGLDPNEVAGRPLRTRTAIVMPIYNEDPQRVAAGLETIWGSLCQQCERERFDLFILSDTADEDIAAQEELMWRLFLSRHHAAGRVFYRRRRERNQRKAGNIADFVQRWGGDYECMIVLDADSIMSGEALVTLARLMEAHPEIGILQSLPLPMGRSTLFGRLIQFGARLQSPMLASGLAFWQLGESNYWGHNAIVRLRPFSCHCSLPRLPGKPPFGGDILSHDFVEAAFMRRAGYEVRQLPSLSGSWEEVPANVIDYAARDRRWTQGNLQHARVLGFPGLHPLSRVHFVTGIMSYVSSPMWLALLLLSSVISVIETAKTPRYFVPGFRSLFPHWPQTRGGEGAALFVLTLVVLLLPKLLGAVLAIRDRQLRAQFGGTVRLCVSLLIEQIFSVLLAPSMMLFHSTFVVQTLLGQCVSWNAQVRTDRGVTLREAFRRQKWQLLFGVTWGALILRLAPQFFWWVSPVLAGLVFGVAVTAWTSRADLGGIARRCGLLLVPEETSPAPELVALERARTDGVYAALTPEHRRTRSAAVHALAVVAGPEPPARPPPAEVHRTAAEISRRA
jgi:membrane glycosyltransferase